MILGSSALSLTWLKQGPKINIGTFFPLTEWISCLFSSNLELNKLYFVKDVTLDDEIKYEWSRIPHFYYNFYVYKYAIGLSCATKIVNDIEAGNKEDYLNFLKTGGSMYPAEELKVANVDINDPHLYIEAINTFNSYIEEYKNVMKGE